MLSARGETPSISSRGVAKLLQDRGLPPDWGPQRVGVGGWGGPEIFAHVSIKKIIHEPILFTSKLYITAIFHLQASTYSLCILCQKSFMYNPSEYQSVYLAWCSCWLMKWFCKESKPSSDEKQNLWTWFESRRRKLSSLTNLGPKQINPTLLSHVDLCVLLNPHIQI